MKINDKKRKISEIFENSDKDIDNSNKNISDIEIKEKNDRKNKIIKINGKSLKEQTVSQVSDLDSDLSTNRISTDVQSNTLGEVSNMSLTVDKNDEKISDSDLLFYENPEEDYYHLLVSNTNIDFQKFGRPPCPRNLPECYLSILWQLISEDYAYEGKQIALCLDYLNPDLKLYFLSEIRKICMSQKTFLTQNKNDQMQSDNDSKNQIIFTDKGVDTFFSKHCKSYSDQDLLYMREDMVWNPIIHVYSMEKIKNNTNFDDNLHMIEGINVIENSTKTIENSEILLLNYMSNMNGNGQYIDDLTNSLAYDKISLIDEIVREMRLKNVNLAQITQEEYFYTYKVFTDYCKYVKNTFFEKQQDLEKNNGITKSLLLPRHLYQFEGEFNQYLKTLKQIQVCVSSEQRFAIINIVEEGKNTFITGGAGVGKSFLLRTLREKFKYTDKPTHVTASTGKASMHIGGRTLHSWSGLGLGDKGFKQALQDIYRRGGSSMETNFVLQRYRRAKVLFIDEISMTDKNFLELFNKMCNHLNRSNQNTSSVDNKTTEEDQDENRFFGGIQMIFCGDFFQLPPVEKGSSGKTSDRYCFLSPIWKKSIQCFIELKKVYRQNDQKFIKVLNQMRCGELTPNSIRLLKTRIAKDSITKNGVSNSKQSHGTNSNVGSQLGTSSQMQSGTSRLGGKLIVPEKAVRLYSKNASVNNLNCRVLRERFKTPLVTFKWTLKFNPQRNVQGKERQFIESFFKKSLTVDEIQKYKVGCRVMLLTNIDQEKNLVNGCTGNIVEFIKTSDVYMRSDVIITEFNDPRDETKYPLVKFDHIETPVFICPYPYKYNNNDKEDDKKTPISKKNHEFDNDAYDKGWTAIVLQLPLAVAHAFSIHKSQGMTIDCVSVHINNCFANGQAYVACSRASSIEGLYLDAFKANSVKTDNVVKEYYKQMNQVEKQHLFEHRKKNYEERRRQQDKYYMGSEEIREIREGDDFDFIKDLKDSSFNAGKYYFDKLKSSDNSKKWNKDQ